MILADTGPLVALFDQRDAHHVRVRQYLASLTGANRVTIPSVIIAEVAYFIPRRVGVAAEARFLRWLAEGTFPVADPIPADYLRAADLVEQYADFPLGTVDALIVAMAERFNVTTILTLDQRHFGAVKPLHCERFVVAP